MIGKVMVVEDEDWFRCGLVQVISETGLNWKVVGEAANGEEALQLMYKVKPDLVISDIRMPVMNGLEMSKLLQEYPDRPDIVIVTGHNDFAYAQSALRYGVKDILLKPCTAEDIQTMLANAYSRLLEQRRYANRGQLEHQTSLNHTMISLLNRSPVHDELSLQLQSECGGRNLWVIEVVTYLPVSKSYTTEDIGLLQFAIHNIVEEIMESGNHIYRLVVADYDTFVCLIVPQEELSQMFEQIGSMVMKLLGLQLHIVPLGQVNKVTDLPRLYEPIHTLKNQADRRMVDVNEIKHTHQIQISDWLSGSEHQLQEGLRRTTDSILQKSLEEGKIEAWSLAQSLSETITHKLNRNQVNEANMESLESLRLLTTTEQLREWLFNLTAGFLRAFEEWQKQTNDDVIDRAIAFVAKEYGGECTLSSAAEHVHLNVTYFSGIFKKKRGEGFNTYVTKVRMERARMLLSHTDIRISEISASVGYNDSNYFTSLFKQQHGFSPSDYRKQHKPE